MQVLKAVLEYDDTSVQLKVGDTTFLDELYVTCELETYEVRHGRVPRRLRLTLHPKQPVKIKSLTLECTHSYDADERVLCNGFQSWSQCREHHIRDVQQPTRGFGKKWLTPFGDQYFYDYPNQEGRLHSWAYTHISRKDGLIELAASLNERTAYTIFEHDTLRKRMIIRKDCEGFVLDHSFPVMDILLMVGEPEVAYDTFAQLMDVERPQADRLLGYTSWYRHYTKITADILRADLVGYAKRKRSAPQGAQIAFQIDDGWQAHVGDWMTINPKLGAEPAALCQEIKAKGYTPGLWMAPFVVSNKSATFKQHKDWLLKDSKGKPVKAGYIPMWGGWFYVLDYYNQEVQKYLTAALLTMTQKWGFRILKLDFLYAVAMLPRDQKTRGQVMSEALDFIRSVVGRDVQLLLCGVPMGTALGRTEYCRIGPDVSLGWDTPMLGWLRSKERLSTVESLRCTLLRWQLDKRMFLNDPDVFILRKKDHKLTFAQQKTLALVNALCGSVLFTSDDASEYADETLELFKQAIELSEAEVKSITQKQDDVFFIEFTLNNSIENALVNLTKKMVELEFHQVQPFSTFLSIYD